MPPSLPPLRTVIATHKLSARKSLGQNFLLDLNLTARIARVGGDLHGVDVLEIGPGPGGLTRALLDAGARRVLAVEKDCRFMPALEQIAQAYPGRLEVTLADAMGLDAHRAPMAHLRAPVRIVANLPYNVGTALLVRWLTPPEWPPAWDSMTLMFQRELALRLVAQPGNKAYGRLALLAQWRTEPRIALQVPPQAFTPAPRVHSAVVHLRARSHPRFEAHAATFDRVVSMAFRQRRKMVRTALKGLVDDIEATLIKAGIDPTRRAESLGLGSFCALSRLVEG